MRYERLFLAVALTVTAPLFAASSARAQSAPSAAATATGTVAGEILVGWGTPAAAAVAAGRTLTATPLSRQGQLQERAALNSRLQAASLGTVAPGDAGVIPQLGVYRVRLNPGVSVAAAIKAAKGMGATFAEPNNRVQALGANDTYMVNNAQYAPQRVQADLAWGLWKPTGTAVIAIVDTGVTLAHPDLVNKLFRDGSNNVIGYNYIANTTNVADDHGHGTHCAGIAAAQVNNGQGVAGIAGWDGTTGTDTIHTKIMPVKVLDANGSGTDSTVAQGVTFAADHGANVISLSLGSSGSSTTLSNAIAYAWNKGCVVVAAAGNSGASSYSYPGAYPNVISVAATDSSDTLASFSNYGSWVTVAAPGVNVLSTYLNGGYANMSGTSMATPLVAGEAALLIAAAPGKTNAQIKAAIVGNTDAYVPYSGRTIGGGRVNVYKALNSITGGSSSAPAPGINLIQNPSFDQDSVSTPTPASWVAAYNTGASYTDTVMGSHTGARHGVHWSPGAYQVSTSQTVTGLASGTYTVRAWVMSSGGQTTAQMFADGFGGGSVSVNIPATSTWTQITIPNVAVTNGQARVGFYSQAAGGKWIVFDDVEFVQTAANTNANLVRNASFDQDGVNTPSPASWLAGYNTWASYTDTVMGSHTGARHGVHWASGAYQVSTSQTITGLTNGTYTLRAWVMSSGGQTTAQMIADNYGGSPLTLNIPTTSTWTQITIPNIPVTNGQARIGFYSVAPGGQWIVFDDVEFFQQ